MRDFRYGYEPYHHLEGDLPVLPPVSHMELGRQEPLIPARQPAFTNTCLAPAEPPEPVTLESLARAMEKLVEEVGPLPPPHPLLDLDRVVIMKPQSCGKSEEMGRIYWKIS